MLFKVILTFDQHGVSSHPNHIKVHHGAIEVLKTGLFPVSLVYCLETRSLFNKYLSFVDIMNLTESLPAFVMFQPWRNWHYLSAHNSQFVWYRKLFLLFSSYTIANQFKVFESREYPYQDR